MIEILHCTASAPAVACRLRVRLKSTWLLNVQLDLAVRLMTAITSAFDAIDRVSKGTELLTPAVQAIAEELIAGHVPAAWERLWDAGDVDGKKWLHAVAMRARALGSWAAAVKSGSGALLGQVRTPIPCLNLMRTILQLL